MKIVLSFLLLITIGISSCQKCNHKFSLSGDYMIIGYTGGLAGPVPLSEYYLIDNGQLRKASKIDQLTDDNTKFDFSTVMPASKYNLVKDLMANIPAELLNSSAISIGLSYPDCGYRDVRACINGTLHVWHFECGQDGNSPEVKQFLATINSLY